MASGLSWFLEPSRSVIGAMSMNLGQICVKGVLIPIPVMAFDARPIHAEWMLAMIA